MKKLLACLFTILIAVTVMAVAAHAQTTLTFTPALMYPGQNQTAVQELAPDALTRALTVNSLTIAMASNIQYAAYSGSGTCFIRTMPTATKVGLSAPLPNTTWRKFAVNQNAPFVNFSGCVAGYVQIQ